MNKNIFPTYSFGDILKMAEKHDRKMDKIFKYNESLNIMTIDVRYPYEISLDRIATPIKLVGWIEHLSEKNWMTKILVIEFIRRVCLIKGWKQHGI